MTTRWTRGKVLDAASLNEDIEVTTTESGNTILAGHNISIKVTPQGAFRDDIPRVFACKMAWKNVARLLKLA